MNFIKSCFTTPYMQMNMLQIFAIMGLMMIPVSIFIWWINRRDK